jgi:hypothetical protein
LYSSKKLAQITQSYAPLGVKIGWLEKQEIYDGKKMVGVSCKVGVEGQVGVVRERIMGS